jgi:hypothetical protein
MTRVHGIDTPFITEGPYGETVLEWWRGDRKLTVYFDGGTVTYLKSWGPDVEREMEDGPVRGMDDLMAWLDPGAPPAAGWASWSWAYRGLMVVGWASALHWIAARLGVLP